MDFRDTENSTPRECQRRVFIDSLYRELDKIASKTEIHNTNLERRSDTLMEQGYDADACVDILTMEGFDSRLARQFVNSYALPKQSSTEDSAKFNYTFEDHRGRIFTGRELGDVVEANSKEEAHSIVRDILGDFDPPVRLLSVDQVS